VRITFAPDTTLPDLSVTVPLMVAVNACDWAARWVVVPKNKPKANSTIVIVATICDRVARLNCIGCASLKVICPFANRFARKAEVNVMSLKAMTTLEREKHGCRGEIEIV
jgi:hypothetical protein